MDIRTSWHTASVLLLSAASTSFAQTAGGTAAGSEGPVFKQEELEQIVAPIALYPDSLVAQVLMASTYPLEVVQAERWAKQNKSLKPDALAAALEKQSWDPSVKSLVNFPQVLTMMSEQLDWTTNLGDAFLAQQKDVMGAVQKLRNKAKSEGNLETTEQQTVVVKEEAQNQVIVIESADPEVIYVPTYNPTVVYGAWPYPAYPPYYYYPPGYVPGTAALSFGLGVAAGAVWANNGWGSCNWGHGDVDIDVRGGNSFNRTNINNSRNASNVGNRNNNVQGGRNSWQHDPSHRKGASYRDQNTANKFGGTSTRDAAKARDSYRGRAETGRQDLARGGADQSRRGQSPTGAGRDQGAGSPSANRPQAQNRSASTAQDRSGAADRPSQSSGNRGGAFDGAGQGQGAKKDSSRGQASRSSPSRSSSGGSSSRGGGGGSRGGMSRGGGGGGRGGRGAGYEDYVY